MIDPLHGALPLLPTPSRERWTPLRGGLMNVFRFDYEEFHFEQGRLLLRGNNGTGKSRVLALLLPFLLDGEVHPHRLEPDSDPSKRIAWNLLMDRYADRLGYAWIEFGRRDADGTDLFRTLGCGLHAIAGKGLHDRWLFSTTRRIGWDLFMQTREGHPLTRAGLREALGTTGEIYESASAYRKAVDKALFQLGQPRYDALVNLLIQLRRPQLSRQLEEEKLSGALSEALSPVSQAMLEDVAEAFRGLEQDREELRAYERSLVAVDAFLEEYRRYTGLICRARAGSVRLQHNVYERVLRGLRELDEQRGRTSEQQALSAARVEELELELARAQAAVETLEASPEMADARRLDSARERARELGEHAEATGRFLAEAEAERIRLEGDCEQHRRESEESEARLRGSLAGALEGAAGCDLREAAEKETAALSPPSTVEEKALLDVRKRLDGRIEKRRSDAAHLAKLARGVAEAEERVRLDQRHQEDAEAELGDALERRRLRVEALATASAELFAAYERWSARVTELEPRPAEALAEALESWCRTGEGRSPVADAVNEAALAATEVLASLERERTSALGVLESEREVVELELEELRAGGHRPPPKPYWRDGGREEGRPGAPLWRLSDFSPELPEEARSGLEAALESSGLLDAWVMPSGELLPAGTHDAVLLALGEGPASGRTLAEALVTPAGVELPVPPEIVRALLSRIGLGEGEGPVWVALDGRWSAGPMAGAWSKPAAEHVGESAREARRRLRIAELEDERERLLGVESALRTDLEQLANRRKVTRDEAAAAPPDGPVLQALTAVSEAAGRVLEHEARFEDALRRTAEGQNELERRRSKLATDARDLGLEAWIADLDGLGHALSKLQASLEALWPAAREYRGVRRRLEVSQERYSHAVQREAGRREQAAESRRRAAAARRELEVFEETVGAAVAEVQVRLEVAREHRRAQDAGLKSTRNEHMRLAVELATLEQKVKDEQQRLDVADEERRVRISRLARIVAEPLLAVSLPDLEAGDPAGWSVTRAVELARQILTRLPEEPSGEADLERGQKAVFTRFQELLERLRPSGYDPQIVEIDHALVVTVPFRGRTCNAAELRTAFASEVAQRQSVLSAREREVIENHLIGDVSSHLHVRLNEAEALVRGMNAEIESRPTSTGMRLRFVWEPLEDGPEGLAEARKRLLKAGALWSERERAAVGSFLHRSIEDVRARQEHGSWLEHLSQALDYRAWHVFRVERWQDGQWKRLTRRTHGTGSGGEKAIALTLPQFAAAAAHYKSADPFAPRLILLDEAFVGIDTDMREKCMGLLAAFDLDFVMTSEREWGCYSTLPGVAIIHLSGRPGVDAVGVSRWVWNGRERIRADVRLPPSAPAPVRSDEDLQPSLPGLGEAG